MSYTSCTNPIHKGGGGEGALVMGLFLSSSQQTVMKLVAPGLKEDFGGGLV